MERTALFDVELFVKEVPSRADSDTSRDGNRKRVKTLTFAGIKAGARRRRLALSVSSMNRSDVLACAHRKRMKSSVQDKFTNDFSAQDVPDFISVHSGLVLTGSATDDCLGYCLKVGGFIADVPRICRHIFVSNL